MNDYSGDPIYLIERIEQLERNNDSLRMEVEAAHHARVKDNEYLIGERDRLAEALEEIRRMKRCESEGIETPDEWCGCVHCIADDALAGEGQT